VPAAIDFIGKSCPKLEFPEGITRYSKRSANPIGSGDESVQAKKIEVGNPTSMLPAENNNLSYCLYVRLF
jgi:hypothetical protein